MNKQTPGPWHACSSGGARPKWYVTSQRGNVVDIGAVKEVDALLIAAAPELYEACKAVAGVFQDSDDPPMYARKCIAALDKAQP
jgi:hypothetical protein